MLTVLAWLEGKDTMLTTLGVKLMQNNMASFSRIRQTHLSSVGVCFGYGVDILKASVRVE